MKLANKRSIQEKKDATAVGNSAGNSAGNKSDDGGHLVAHIFMKDQGLKNLFAQDSNFNRSAFKKMENDFATAIEKGYEVHFTHEIKDFDVNTGRPDAVNIEFEIFDPSNPKKAIKAFENEFLNNNQQEYTSIWDE